TITKQIQNFLVYSTKHYLHVSLPSIIFTISYIKAFSVPKILLIYFSSVRKQKRYNLLSSFHQRKSLLGISIPQSPSELFVSSSSTMTSLLSSIRERTL